MKRILRWAMILILVALILMITVAVRGPYLFPVKLALGPCFADPTSPSSYALLRDGPRASPLKTLRFNIDDATVQVCYGRPAARGRLLFGPADSTAEVQPLVPYGRPWRTGANEPTRLFVNKNIVIGDLDLPAGRYSLYTVPGPEVWEIVVNSSITHWGNDFGEAVRRRNLGSVTAVVEPALAFAEQLTITPETSGDEQVLVVHWGERQVRIPLRR